MVIEILGRKKGRYNPDLGRIANEAFEKEARKARIKPVEVPVSEMGYDERQAAILDTYRRWLKRAERFGLPLSRIKKFKPITQEDIDLFCTSLFTIRDEFGSDLAKYTAPYLSCMAIYCDSEQIRFDFELLTKSLNKVDPSKTYALDHVGRQLSKKRLQILGNVGDKLGHLIEDFSIHVEGDAGENVGHLAINGQIYVEGKIGSAAKNRTAVDVFQRDGGGRWRKYD